MSFDEDLVKGLAMLLDDKLPAGLAVKWDEGAAYTDADCGIYHRAVPEKADRLITLSPFPLEDHLTLSDSVVGLQVRTRWGGADPRLVDRLADAVFDVLQGYGGFLSTGVRVVSAVRRSGVSLGQDPSKRWARSDNYYLDVHRPSTNRT